MLRNDFQEIEEQSGWELRLGGKYFLTRGFGSSLVAFTIPKKITNSYFKIVATHTDSPCIRLAPNFKAES